MSALEDILHFSVFFVIWRNCVSGTQCGFEQKEYTAKSYPLDIMSEGYPNKYLPDTFCRWTIKSQKNDTAVVIETIDISLQNTDGCKNDYIQVFDGEDTSTAIRNWTLCGEDRRMIVSTGRFLLLIFKSDARYETRGFRLQYYQAPANAPCNHHMDVSYNGGSFTSPGYPNGYFSNMECNYTISSMSPYIIEISVVDSDIEDASHCQYDRLSVYDTNYETEQVLGTVCGRDTPTYRSTGNTMLVQFVTNNVKVNKGFQIRYSIISPWNCSNVHLEATKMDSYLQAPPRIYGSFFTRNLTCDWEIYSAVANRTIELTTVKSNISGPYPNCTDDRVEISDMSSTGLNSVFCGSATPSFHIRNSARISMHTVDAGQGFLMKYTQRPENGPLPPCGGSLDVNSSKQILLSPLYPQAPLTNQTCIWHLKTSDPNEIIVVSLTDLDVEMSSNCQFDRMTIYDSNSDTDNKMLETWCGQRGGEVVHSTGQYLTIVYSVDDSNNGRGFSLTYYSEKGTSLTNQTFRLTVKDSISYLSSPGFLSYLPRNGVFSYVFMADPGRQIKLEVMKSSLPGESGSCSDGARATVYDGQSERSPRLASSNTMTFTWCGLDMPVYISSGNRMFLVYHPESLGSKNQGFQLTYIQGNFTDVQRHECGGGLEATSVQQNLTSKDYPQQYVYRDSCRWVIHASTPGHMVRVVGVDIFVGRFLYGDCGFGSLIFYDGVEAADKVIDTWCDKVNSSVQSSGNQMTIVYKSDGPYKIRFDMRYFETTEPLLCESSFDVVRLPGHITSKANTTCRWIFTRDSDAVAIELKMRSYPSGVNTNQTCGSNYIDIHSDLTEDSPLLGRYCGGEEQTYTGSGDHMFIKAVSGPNPVVWFDIRYETTSYKLCWNNFLDAHNYSRVLTSPYYLHQYPNNLDCEWHIHGEEDDIINIEVVQMDVEYSVGCQKDYLAIVDNRWCGTETPKYHSRGSFVDIKFHTDSQVSRSGFKLKYWKEYHPYVYEPHNGKPGLVLGILGGVLGAIIIVVITVWCVCRRRTSQSPVSDEKSQSSEKNTQL